MSSWTGACQASLSITNSQSLFKLASIESVMPSNHLILCHPLLLLFSIFPSIRVFSKELVLRSRWPKCWSFSFSISPSNEYSGQISFESESEVAQSCPTLCDPMDTRLLRPWDFLGKSTGVGCLFLLQQTSRPRDRTQVLLHCKQGLYRLSHQGSLGWLVWSSCSPGDSQESSPTPQFKSINSSVLSCLYSPTLTSLHG